MRATNGTLNTKVESESNFFLSIPTEEPKLNHLINTILKQLPIQLSHPVGVIRKFLSKSPFFPLKYENIDIICILKKLHRLEKLKEGEVKN